MAEYSSDLKSVGGMWLNTYKGKVVFEDKQYIVLFVPNISKKDNAPDMIINYLFIKDGKSTMANIGALWYNKEKNYFSGKMVIEDVERKLMVFFNKNRKDNAPDLIVNVKEEDGNSYSSNNINSKTKNEEVHVYDDDEEEVPF